jgi:hypothetical protein
METLAWRSRLAPDGTKRAMQMRRHPDPTDTPEQHPASEAQRLRDAAKALPPGAVRDAAIRKAREIEAAAHMNEWLISTGSLPSK